MIACRTVTGALAVCGMFLLVAPSLCAAEPKPPSAPTPSGTTFRRIHAPADSVQNWPRDNVRYVPIAPQEFERLVSLGRGNDATTPPVARIVSASFTARFVEPDQLRGTAQLEIDAAAATGHVSLSPWNMVIENAQWSSNDMPATVGVDARGRTLVQVEESGVLNIEWALRGTPSLLSGVDFVLGLPATARGQVRFDLREGLELQGTTATTAATEVDGRPGTSWRVELGGRTRLSVRILPRGALGDPLPEVRTHVLYDVTPHGIDLAAQWRLDPGRQALFELRAVLDPGVQLVDVTMADKSLRWTALPALADGRQPVAIELPEASRGTQRTVRLTALGSWEVSSPWKLPRLIPENVAWREGTVTVTVPAPLTIAQLTPTDCRLIRTAALPAPRIGETFDFQLWDPAATARLVIVRQRDRLHCAKLVELEMREDAWRAQVTADLSLPMGERFTLRADAAEDWIVDDLYALPAEALLDWSLESVAGKPRRINLRLAQALAPQQPLRVTVLAHRRAQGGNERWPWSACQVIDFDQAVLNEDLLALRTPGWRVDVLGQGPLQQINRAQLSAAQRSLASHDDAEVFWRLDPHDSPPRVALRRQPVRLDVDLRVDVAVDQLELSEAYTLVCRPVEGPVDRLRVRFTSPRSVPLQWSCDGQTGGTFSFRRVAHAATPDKSADDVGEAWDIFFERPMRHAFTLQATRSIPAAASTPVSLAQVEPADDQRGVLVVRAAADTPLVIHNRRLQSIVDDETPAPSSSTSPSASNQDMRTGASMTVGLPAHLQQLPTRSMLQFDPTRERVEAADPAVTLERPAQAVATRATIVWTSQLLSQYQASGLGMHELVWTVRNWGDDQLSFRVDSDIERMQVTVDGIEATAKSATQPREFSVPLRAGRSLVNVALRFATREAPLHSVDHCSPPAIKPIAPVLVRRWRVWLPEGFAAVDCRSARWLSPAAEGSWMQRWFGPLGRSAQRTTFDPLLAETWRTVIGESSQRAAAHDLMQPIVVALGKLLAPIDASERPTTWGELWMRLEILPASQHVVWLVDRMALDDAGIEPALPLPKLEQLIATGSDFDRASRLLREAGLVLITDGSIALVTTASSMGASGSELAELLDGTAFWLEPGPLQVRLAAGMASESMRYVRIGAWRTESADLPMRPRLTTVGAEQPGDPVYDLELADDAMPQLLIRQRSLNGLLTAALALATLGLSITAGRRVPAAPLLLAVFAAAAALLVPQFATGWTAAMTLGSVVGLIAHVVLLPRIAKGNRTDDETRSALAAAAAPPGASASSAAGAAGVVAAIGFVAALGASAALAAEANREAGAEYRVFIPSDDKGEPTGGHYLVPEPLFNALQLRALGENATGWLLTQAQYRVTLASNLPQRSFEISELVGIFDLTVSRAGTMIELPLGADAGPTARALLDGRPVEANWDRDRQRLQVDVPQAGDVRLELLLQPVLRFYPDGTGFDFAAPTTPSTTVTVWLPNELVMVASPVAVGPARHSREQQSLTFTLGDSRRIALHWQDARGAAPAATSTSSDELLWLRVRPGSVVIDARWTLHVESGALREVALLADARLRPLTGTATVDGAEATWTGLDVPTPPNLRAWRLNLPRPIAESAAIDTSFLWTDVAGVGHLRMPVFDLVAMRRLRRWVALSIDSTLAFDLHGVTTSGDVQKFLTAWGEAPAPQRVIEQGADQQPWRLSIRPRPVEISAVETVELNVDRTQTRVLYLAELTTKNGSSLQYNFHVPAALQVERIALQEDGVERVTRWSQDGTSLVLFLSEPAGGPQQVVLEGIVNHAAAARLDAPLVWLGEKPHPGGKVLVYRRPAVQLKVQSLRDLKALDDAGREQNASARARLAVAWEITGVAPQAPLQLADNHPRTTADQTTTVTREGQNWLLDVESHWKVDDGQLDVLRFRLANSANLNWTAPGAAKVETAPDTDSRFQQLLVVPQAAVQGDYAIHLRATLSGSGRTMSIPELIPWGVESSRRWLALPQRQAGQNLYWKLSGWRPVERPGEEMEAASDTQVYAAVDDAATAQLEAAPPAAAPVLYLADVQIHCDDSLAYHGLIQFDVASGAADHVALRTPGDCQILSATVDDQPVTLVANDDGTYRVTMARNGLAQRLEVAFAGRLAQRSQLSSRLQVEIPSLVGLDAEHTLWTFVVPRSWRASLDASASRGAWGLDLLRLQALVAIAGQPEARQPGLESAVGQSWFATWNSRWQTVHARIGRELGAHAAGGARTAAENKIAALEQELSHYAAAWGDTRRNRASSATSIDAADYLIRSQRRGHTVVRGALQGSSPKVELHCVDETTGDLLVRGSVALGMIGLAISMAVFCPTALRRGVLRTRYAALVITAVGVACWLGIEPSALGMVVMLLGAWGGLRGMWRGLAGRAWRPPSPADQPLAATASRAPSGS